VNCLRERRRDPEQAAGFTIIEVVITMSLLSLVMVIILSSLWTVQKSETFTRGREAAIDNMRISLNRISRDLRQATTFASAPTPSHVDFYTYVNGTTAHVVYDVSAGVITRQLNGGGKVAMHKELTDNNIFTYCSDVCTGSPADARLPDTVDIELVVQPSNLPKTQLTLSAEVQLRNREEDS
jgi:prepilin-type N-terminal cleavage/methylation domain-containing protein